MTNDFASLGVSQEILKAIDELGFVSPMPVQEQVIPVLTGSDGTDIIALAQTGTGKTAGYGIPLLMGIDSQEREIQALVLAPTRELCVQIADDLEAFSKYMDGIRVLAVYGGTSMDMQIRSLKKGVHIVVATPGRLIDLMNRGKLTLEGMNTVVLDEADEMLNMGFQESIEQVFENVPETHHTWLFSATMGHDVERVAKRYLHDYKEIVVGSRNEGAENVNHIYYLVNAKDKYLALKRVVDYFPKIFAIIFCRTKLETQEIADKLIRDGYNAESLHGDLSQQQRDLTMQKFRQHTVQLLVATDVAARGLDVDDLTHVINYGIPDDTESYTHRSGRTGRAGKKGTSISIIHTREKHRVREIEKVIGKEFVDGELPKPEEICKKQLYKVMDQILKCDVDEEQIAPFMSEINRHFEYIDKEDIIKKMVSMQFGQFLEYYKNAPVIEKPSTKQVKERSEGKAKKPRTGEVEKGYTRLFINLGKDDGFYPGEVMQFINKNMGGRQKVGHIDLYGKFAYIEVPTEDAENVMASLTGKTYRKRTVRCNPADDAPQQQDGGAKRGGRSNNRGENHNDTWAGRPPRQERSRRQERQHGERPERGSRSERQGRQFAKEDWMQFLNPKSMKKRPELRGEEPDFSEEGWARRRRKK